MATMTAARFACSRAMVARARARRLRERSRGLRADAIAVATELLENLALARSSVANVSESRDRFSLTLPRLEPAVAFARNDFSRWLVGGGVSRGDAFEIGLACSEVVANAVEHPVARRREAFSLAAAWHDGELRVTVRDFGRWSKGTPSVERGRGLMLIRELMDAVAIDRDDDGTCVTMHRRVRRGGTVPAPAG
jgi:anti-sigma regulatory factor (Ser/Thr protein kinase)